MIDFEFFLRHREKLFLKNVYSYIYRILFRTNPNVNKCTSYALFPFPPRFPSLFFKHVYFSPAWLIEHIDDIKAILNDSNKSVECVPRRKSYILSCTAKVQVSKHTIRGISWIMPKLTRAILDFNHPWHFREFYNPHIRQQAWEIIKRRGPFISRDNREILGHNVFHVAVKKQRGTQHVR